MTDTSGPPASHGAALAPQRSQLVGTVVSLVTWLVVALPIILMSVIIFAEVMRPDRGMWDPRNIALMFVGAVLMFAMVASPHLLGQAVRFRERAMWRSAIITGVPTLCVVVYFIFRWLSNLG
ncbi:hypothetical protein ART_3832 [Arthrobacter sp. PAMC 25486]|uniref:hypothetical protein n=1 Tax=Arthrobacter sp. PAMC 25486 TaxID=1494608 RepID=UPI0005362B75|nr:hypothetical protein [Arthrobacter sp. PAMC 25486]AIY03431.1 hypothetical protein ART_3832 [Arthrobacter sp. PAMC 25486]